VVPSSGRNLCGIGQLFLRNFEHHRNSHVSADEVYR
jgi:hypothetical protein